MSLDVAVLVVAKAPVPGFAKTRLAREVGDVRAADLAAASLLDTLDAVLDARVAQRVVAITGDLDRAVQSPDITAALGRFTVVPQRGDDFAERLVNAHADAFAAFGLPVLQIGMDTPQVTAGLLADSAGLLTERPGRCVLGLAEDGGWWILGVPDADAAEAIRPVPTSSPDTGRLTRDALLAAGAEVLSLPTLRDVDYATDVAPVAALCRESSRFRREYLSTARG
ncbi:MULTISPECIES: DUF2064 domain-containing protein [unclassified Rhodococcus (in: high G+C Gram-positive bacteria)]|uniref:TIGR04282 family arsenosugar biosynthesis glycosyltransferase n=1 Tax=unclassified Rhodococcus (in: high G+C Gram-positive bacteria) TaxID=192944 RepID=UPI00163A3BE5|nr:MULTISPECIES: DUF2064 domain-containing protein [unclassified Rhodococcus (in: high G+C Gram-positive bacteria)]MBC2641557.1 DUF2064 domain-containing protein [Rhodococcus sp. 3A]MBC2893698.1 DUF2064 domain-containing protein [Rhodococcus sp. 4CII]